MLDASMRNPSRQLLRTPPGPSAWELLPRIRWMQREPIAFLCDLSQRYDRMAFFKAGSPPVYVLHAPELIKLVLLEHAKRYSKDTIQFRALATITGRGLLTSDGALWHKQRRLAQPAFSKTRTAAPRP